jgi:hypothetical protein
VVVAEGLEESGVAIVVTSAQDEASALDIPLHDLKKFADFMVSLLLAVANIGKGEKRLSAAEAATKLG